MQKVKSYKGSSFAKQQMDSGRTANQSECAKVRLVEGDAGLPDRDQPTATCGAVQHGDPAAGAQSELGEATRLGGGQQRLPEDQRHLWRRIGKALRRLHSVNVPI